MIDVLKMNKGLACLERHGFLFLFFFFFWWTITVSCGWVLLYFGTSGFPRFESAAQTITILYIVQSESAAQTITILYIVQRLLSFLRLTILTGRVFRRILNDFSFPMALSTWILTRDIFLECVTSNPVNCFLPFVDAGTWRRTHLVAKYSGKLKPRSAITWSPSSKSSINPEFFVITLSLVRPPQTFDKKCNSSCWTNTNKELHSIMWFIVGVCDCPCLQTSWPLNEHFSTVYYTSKVYYTSNLLETSSLEEGGEISSDIFPGWPPDKVLQLFCHYIEPFMKDVWDSSTTHSEAKSEVLMS